MRLAVRFWRANLEGRLEEGRRLLLERTQGGALNVDSDVASWDLWTNRPRPAAEFLRNPALEQDLKEPIGVYYFLIFTGALHQLGEHEQELVEARRGVSFHPDLLNMRAYEARALVALGRLAETDALVDEMLAMAPRWGFAKCCVPNGTPGYVMLSVGEELRAHGHRGAAVRIAGRTAEWYRSRPGDEAEAEENRAGLGESLYRAWISKPFGATPRSRRCSNPRTEAAGPLSAAGG